MTRVHELTLVRALGAHGAAVGRGAEPVATSSIHHEEHELARTDKLTKLIAVFDLFFDAIARLDDPTAFPASAHSVQTLSQ